MPQAAALWVLGWASAGVGLGVTAAYTLAALAYVGTVLGISYALGAVSQALMGRPKLGGGASWREMTVKAPTAARAIVYGEIVTGGVLVFQHTTGSKNQYLDYVIVLAGHQITEISDVWVDDILVTNAQINGGAAAGGAVTDGELDEKYGTPILYFYKYLGTSGQTASTQLSATDGSGYGPDTWSTDHRLRGCAYVHVRVRRTDYWEKHGAPSNFRFKIKGAKVYDPRLDSTNGGTGTQRLNDATTWTYSNNPALCVADYVAGGTIGNDVATPVRKRGFAVLNPATAIDWDAVIAAANECDEDVTIPPASPATTQNRYECDVLLVPSDDSPDADCLDQLLTSMVGQLTYTRGRYVIHAGAAQTPVYTLTEADLAGPLQYITGHGRSERYNYVRGTRYDRDNGTETEFLPRTDSSYVTDDGATLYHDISLPATTDEYRAQRIAQLILRRSREQQTLIWPGQFAAAKIGIWETCLVTVAELGISAKTFRCIARKRRSGANGDPVVELTLREENSSTYSDPLVADYDTISVATDPGPATPSVEEPTGLTATSLAGGILFTITPAAGTATDVVYELYEHTASTPFSSATLVWSGNSTKPILSKSGTTTRYYWVVARQFNTSSANYPATTGVSGTAGAEPVDGDPGLTISLSVPLASIACDAAGVPISGAFTNAAGQVTVYSGTTDVTASATYSSTTSNCTGSVNTATNTPVTGAKGSYRITALSAESGYLEITVTYNSIAVPIRFTAQKVRAGSASQSAQDTSFSDITVSSYPATGQAAVEIAVGPSGSITVSATGYYQCTIAADTTVTAKIQYRDKAVGGAWTDVTGSETIGSASDHTLAEAGSFTISPMAGPTAPASVKIYEFQLVMKATNLNATFSLDEGEAFSASWSP